MGIAIGEIALGIACHMPLDSFFCAMFHDSREFLKGSRVSVLQRHATILRQDRIGAGFVTPFAVPLLFATINTQVISRLRLLDRLRVFPVRSQPPFIPSDSLTNKNIKYRCYTFSGA